MTTRQLAKLEQEFVNEAEAHFFTVDYTEQGTPFAIGASHTSNLFSMEVKEIPTTDGDSIYILQS